MNLTPASWVGQSATKPIHNTFFWPKLYSPSPTLIFFFHFCPTPFWLAIDLKFKQVVLDYVDIPSDRKETQLLHMWQNGQIILHVSGGQRDKVVSSINGSPRWFNLPYKLTFGKGRMET